MTRPKPECHYGYPATQVDAILAFGPRQQAFWDWMAGQTMMICEARPQMKRVYEDDRTYHLIEVGPSLCDNPHGTVVYPWDFERFLAGRPIID